MTCQYPQIDVNGFAIVYLRPLESEGVEAESRSPAVWPALMGGRRKPDRIRAHQIGAGRIAQLDLDVPLG